MALLNDSSSFSSEKDSTLADLTCLLKFSNGAIHRELTCLIAVNIVLSITAILGNTLILIALHKDSSLHPPSKLLFRTLATTDLCVGLIAHPLNATTWISELEEQWDICRSTSIARFLTSYILCSMSLLTATTAISVDRLLALRLMLRYRQIVTLRRTHVAVVGLWVVSIVGTVVSYLNGFLSIYSNIIIAISLLTSVFSYFKIFLLLRRNKTEPHQTTRSQASPLNTALYRKTVYSALWIQLALGVCYLPYGIVQFALTASKNVNPFTAFVWGLTGTLVYMNSSLNPILYCWKIREVKQAVMETLRRIRGRCSSISKIFLT